MEDLRDLCILNPDSKEYDGMCFSCYYYNDYGPVGGRFSDYNGKCKADGHETDALVRCKNNQYKHR